MPPNSRNVLYLLVTILGNLIRKVKGERRGSTSSPQGVREKHHKGVRQVYPEVRRGVYPELCRGVYPELRRGAHPKGIRETYSGGYYAGISVFIPKMSAGSGPICRKRQFLLKFVRDGIQ